MIDEKPGAVQKARQAIEQRVARDVQREQMSKSEADTLMENLIEADWPDIPEAQIAVEAVLEVMDVKKSVFQQLERLMPTSSLLATNTSSLSITEIASTVSCPERVLGMHFFNPAPVMKLIEIVRGEETSDDSVNHARSYAESIGKDTVVVQKDTPGFVVNRVLMPLFIEAMRIYEEGIASKEDIDKAIKLGLNHPMGPLTLADLTGLDVDLNVMDYLYNEFHDDRFAAPLVLRRLVRAGRLGRKTQKGFYDY